MKHIFRKGNDQSKPVLLMLHGTGGTEYDLLPLAEEVSPEASILSVRGNILENGMPRFFKRLAEGVFDEEDLVFRTKELYEFIHSASKQYDFDPQNVVAIGYSNGANIAASLMFHYDRVLKGAILHHPMVPIRGLMLPDLSDVQIFIGAGINDPIGTSQETKELESLLASSYASVTVHWESNGHQLTTSEVAAARKWYRKYF